MSPTKEQRIRQHAARQGITITRLPSGAYRLTGGPTNVNILVCQLEAVNLEDLTTHRRNTAHST